jgi:choline kinase
MRSWLPMVLRCRSMASVAVFGVAHVVVHRFGNGDNFYALLIQMRGVTKGVVAADGDQIIQFQLLDILEHLWGHVVDR